MNTQGTASAQQPSALKHAALLEQHGQTRQAELLYRAVYEQQPACVEAVRALARLAAARGDPGCAHQLLSAASAAQPEDAPLASDLSSLLWRNGRPAEARGVLERLLQRSPDWPVAWLSLARIREELGDANAALRARFEAVTRAQRAGLWLDEESTPPALLQPVLEATRQLREHRRALLFGSYAECRDLHGPAAVARVDRALSGYLREWDATPPDPRQRPKFFYFPGLPDQPFHDPAAQPWAARLADAFEPIRAEALELLEQEASLPDFLNLGPGDRVERYLAGEGHTPSWEAFFFYRRGQRFDANHARCPRTSEALESIELCRIDEQAPEICFSVLKPGTHILPHHGVTNTRLVMHLPLLVPPDCALHLLEAGEHAWREGELVMFDDTYRHEAWNRSDRTRVVLLMDCWNPYLTAVEKQAVKRLVETISALHLAARATGQAAVQDPAGA